MCCISITSRKLLDNPYEHKTIVHQGNMWSNNHLILSMEKHMNSKWTLEGEHTENKYQFVNFNLCSRIFSLNLWRNYKIFSTTEEARDIYIYKLRNATPRLWYFSHLSKCLHCIDGNWIEQNQSLQWFQVFYFVWQNRFWVVVEKKKILMFINCNRKFGRIYANNTF